MGSTPRQRIVKSIEVYHRRLSASGEDDIPFRARPDRSWDHRKAEYIHVATVTVFASVTPTARQLGALELAFRIMQFEPEVAGETAHVMTALHRPRKEVRPTSVGDVLIYDGQSYEVGPVDFVPIGPTGSRRV